jgi:hypothetical protein
VKSDKNDQSMNAPEKSGADKPKAGRTEPSEFVSQRNTIGRAPLNGDAQQARPPQALDRWFDDQLNRLFNDVSSEPLPPDLANLIGQLKKQSDR